MSKFLLQGFALVTTLFACYGILSYKAKDSSLVYEQKVEMKTSSSRFPASVSAELKPVNPLAMSQSENSLVNSKDVNYWERELKTAIISRRHSDKISGGENIGGEVIKKMRQYPHESLVAFKSLLQKLPAEEFPFDRASLIDAIADFPELRKEAKEIAREELAQSVVKQKVIPQNPESQEELDKALASDDFDFLPMISHSVLIRTSDSAKEALELTIEAIKSQEDLGMRDTLAQQFTTKYPQLEKNLDYELKRARIEMPMDPTLLPN